MPELNTLGPTLKSTYEGQPDTNAFTDAEKSKLAGIQPGAQVNVPAPVQSVAGRTGDVELSTVDISGLQDIISGLESRLSALESAQE